MKQKNPAGTAHTCCPLWDFLFLVFHIQTHHCALQRCFRTRYIQICFAGGKTALRTGTCLFCTGKVDLVRPLDYLCHDSYLLRQNGDESGHQRCFLLTAVLMDFENARRYYSGQRLSLIHI